MTDKYKVGYSKPPKTGQFQSGHSGNPKGRLKGSKNFKTELKEELQEKIPIKESGKSMTISKQRAMLKALTAKAIKGDAKAASVIIGMIFKLFHDDHAAPESASLSIADKKILENFEAAILQQHGTPSEPTN